MGVRPISTVYLSLGSNLGDRFQHLQNAQVALSKVVGEISTVSRIYENPPSGFDADQDFLNICLSIETGLAPAELLKTLKKIESELGRTMKSAKGYSSRCIDIDIILYLDIVFQSENLTLPHPQFRKRMFVLKPLNDIAPNEIDPVTMLTIEQLFLNCGDTSTLNFCNP